MNNQQISERVFAALEGLSSNDPWWWTHVAVLAFVALLAAVTTVTVVGLRNLRRQECFQAQRG